MRVNDWRNDAGSHSISTTSKWLYQLEHLPYPWDTPLSLSSTVVVGRRFKSATQRGSLLKLPDGTLFRKATAYRRCIIRLTSGGSAIWHTTSGGYRYMYVADDSRHASGVTLSNQSGFNLTTGLVSVNSNIVNRAVAEALNKVRNNRIELGTSLAEAGRTIDHLAGLCARLVRLYSAFRSRAGFARTFQEFMSASRGSSRTARAASKAWLEYKYAITPLMSDIRSVMDIAQKGLSRDTLLFNVQRTVTGPLAPDGFIMTSSERPNSTISGRMEESAKVTFWGRIMDPRLTMYTALGLDNPWAIAWEIVPFSFVIDWLLPIGDWLRSITATLGVTYVDGHIVRRVCGWASASPNNPGFGTFTSGIRPSGTVRLYAMNRDVYIGFPWALPYVKSPFSTSHVTSFLALLGAARR